MGFTLQHVVVIAVVLLVAQVLFFTIQDTFLTDECYIIDDIYSISAGGFGHPAICVYIINESKVSSNSCNLQIGDVLCKSVGDKYVRGYMSEKGDKQT